MKPKAKLIHKTYMSYMPTAFPAYYYGMPNGKVYIIFSRFYDIKFGDSGLEFIFAVHNEFSYDYEKEKIIPSDTLKKQSPIFAESIDKPDPKFNILKINRRINSYGEALNYLNKEVRKFKMYV